MIETFELDRNPAVDLLLRHEPCEIDMVLERRNRDHRRVRIEDRDRALIESLGKPHRLDELRTAVDARRSTTRVSALRDDFDRERGTRQQVHPDHCWIESCCEVVDVRDRNRVHPSLP